jgi:hypothetical protein
MVSSARSRQARRDAVATSSSAVSMFNTDDVAASWPRLNRTIIGRIGRQTLLN